MRYHWTFIMLFIFYFSANAQENPQIVDIPKDVFVNGGKTDFETLTFKDDQLIDKVKTLFKDNELSHDFQSDFTLFWKYYKNQWEYIQFHEGGDTLILFTGIRNIDDEREYVELFDLKQPKYKRIVFSSVGKLLAYKKHPFTDELILYVHQFPCCRSASHSIYTIREVNGMLHTDKRFFLGRDAGDMVGPFFPNSITPSATYHRLKDTTELRWSPAIVEKNAYLNWTDSNLIIHYTPGALYKILYEKDGWQFVIFFSGIAEEQSTVLNYTNFINTGVYGWIKI